MSSFDFEECLRLARDLAQHADDIATFATNQATERDRALDEWHGWYGDKLRTRGVDTDNDLAGGIARVELASEVWVSTWQQEVDRHNEAVYREQRADHLTWLGRQEMLAQLERVDYHRFSALNPALEPPAIVRWLNAGAPATIDAPQPASRPANFSPIEAAFASFERSDYDLVITYSYSPSQWPAGVVL